MSNQLKNTVATLAGILAQNKLTKSAGGQDIEHKTPLSQDGIGAEQTQELRDGQYNVTADTPAAANTPKEKVQEEPAGIQSLNKSPEAALNASGTSVEKVTTDGAPSSEPADLTQSKAAALQYKLASILSASKKANQEQPAIMTGTEVLAKIASLTEKSSDADLEEARASIVKLASTNPLFGVCKERITQEIMANDIIDLAKHANITLEKAAAELDAAVEANPEMAQEIDDEATEAAIGDLADVEQAAAEIGPGVEEMAANASQALGTEVSPDDILDAADEVAAQAEQLGVAPEALIEAALQELQGGAAAEPDEEDMANAQQILDAAAEQGISPEEVIEMAAGMAGDGGEAPAEPAEPAAVPAPEEDKTASAKQPQQPQQKPQQPAFQSKRAAYCAYIREHAE